MCTVTFIPAPDKVILTSNRDEKHGRSPAIVPTVYDYPSGQLLFPKDADAGGTWIAAHENGNAVVFLNGGWLAHTPQPPYRKSRGLILLDLLDSTLPYRRFHEIPLENIEPFTAIIWQDRQLFECRWDGATKYDKPLDTTRAHIWSSVTLYDEAVIARRRQWFETWLGMHRRPFQEDILHFHQFAGDGDAHNDVRMNRDGKVFTVSVTSLAIGADQMEMHYLDLLKKQSYTRDLSIEKIMMAR